MARLQQKYRQEIVPQLKQQFNLVNDLAVPKITKIIINVGVTDDQHRDEAIKNVTTQISAITGQKPNIRVARKSIAGFKLRAGDPIATAVTLRSTRMYHFLDKLIAIVLPRVKDFQGLPFSAFDGHGNYNLGLTEQIIFPEIDYDKIDTVRGLQITLVTSTNSDEQAQALLTLMGFPFEKDQENKSKIKNQKSK